MPTSNAVPCPRGAARHLWLALALSVGFSHPAWAHAHLRKSDPGAHATVSPPGAIRLWFTEEPELMLTVVRLTDSAGTVVALGAPLHDVDGALSVRLSIATALHPGRWTVTWKTAALDGHPSNGTFTFRVAELAPAVTTLPSLGANSAGVITPPAAPAKAESPAASNDPDALTPMYVVARALSFIALLALIGAAAFRYTVVARLPRGLVADSGVMMPRLATGATAAAVFYLVAAAVRLSLQNQMMTGDAMLDTAHMRSMAMETHWGAIWRLQFGAGVAALLAALSARRGQAAAWPVIALCAIALALSSALGGHAAGSESFRTLSVVDDTLHVVGAAGWLGSLLWLTVVAIPSLQRANDRASKIASMVRAFSPTALGFAALVGATGLVSAWLRLGSVHMLWSSSYGQALLVKLILLGGVAATGFYNWRYVQPALGTDGASARLLTSARAELVVGLLVIIATAVLVAMPTPMMPAAQ